MSDLRARLRTVLSSYEPELIDDGSLTPSAVLMILFGRDEDIHFLLTKRARSLTNHSGEISFPGGVRAATDRSLMETALRETREEVGIDRDALELVGRLDDYATVTGFRIAPFVATLDGAVRYCANPHEVAAVLEVPLDIFLTSDHLTVERGILNGEERTIYFYHYGDHIIWGATAFILHRFVFLLTGYDPAAALDGVGFDSSI